jgi:hypothetical protein
MRFRIEANIKSVKYLRQMDEILNDLYKQNKINKKI